MRLIRLGHNRSHVDTLGVFFGGETLVLMRDGQPTGSSHVPLGRYGFATAHGDATYYLDGGTNEVRRLGTAAGAVLTMRVEAEPLTRPEREARIAEFLRNIGNMPPSFVGAVESALVRDLQRPAPVFDSLLVDRTGRVWARETRRPSLGEAQWLVASPQQDAPAARLRLPATWQVLEAGSDYLLVADHDVRGRTVVMEYSLSQRR